MAVDLAELRGQVAAKRAMEVAMAGGHHIALVGPTGCGKSSLAAAFSSLLPAPTRDQSDEPGSLYQEAGRPWPTLLETSRPVVVPSIESTPSSLIGGHGAHAVGQLALANHGLVIVDDAERFRPRVLSVVREALDRGEVHPRRGAPCPTKFQLLVTARAASCIYIPSPCDDPMGCGLRRAAPALSWFIDIVDVHVALEQPTACDWTSTGEEEASATVLQRLIPAQLRQASRGIQNRDLAGRALMQACEMEPAACKLLDTAILAQGLSARDVAATLRVARTLADLEGIDRLARVHVAEALIYRFLPARINLTSAAAARRRTRAAIRSNSAGNTSTRPLRQHREQQAPGQG